MSPPDRDDGAAGADPEVVLRLPDALRPELKEPLGPVYADADALLADADPDAPLIAVGDVVTYHLLGRRRPDVALVDGKTERTAVDREVRAAIDGEAFGERRRVRNPAATLSGALLSELRAAVERDAETAIEVTDGEEDLAALPAALLAPDGASVVYGQPGEGMVLARVDEGVRATVRDLLARFEGDHERASALLGVEYRDG
ncbi:MAG: GTP-dependent dephospho-CoA kinase family protein [Haloarculaceae archaeon]